MIDEEAVPMYRDSIIGPAPELRYSGIRALWLKVILRAIFDWVTYRHSTKLMQRKMAENAYNWLFQPNALFNSFENVCKMLDIDPDTIRERAEAMTPMDIAKIEYLEREGECDTTVAMLQDGGTEDDEEVA